MLNGLEEILAKHGLSDEVKAALLADVNGATEGLINKKSELEGKLANKEQLTAAEKAQLVELQTFKSNAEIKANEESEKYHDAKAQMLENHKTELASYKEKIEQFEKGERTRLITDGIRSELTALNVNPLLSDAVTSLFEAQSKVVDGKAMIGDKTQSEFINEWSLTDSGKASILGQQNQNGGGLGGGDNPQPKGRDEAIVKAEKSGDLKGFISASMSTEQT